MAKGKSKKRQNMHKTKGRVARTPQQIRGEFWYRMGKQFMLHQWHLTR